MHLAWYIAHLDRLDYLEAVFVGSATANRGMVSITLLQCVCLWPGALRTHKGAATASRSRFRPARTHLNP